MNNKEERSLATILETFKSKLPVQVTVSRECILKNEKVLEKGQELTILDHKLVKLMLGKDWSGKPFRINTNEQASLYVDLLDEFYPKNVADMKQHFNKYNYMLLKQSLVIGDDSYKICEKFTLNKNEQFLEDTISVNTFCGKRVRLKRRDLLDRNLFVFIHYKETVTLQSLLLREAVLSPQVVRFVNGASSKVPSGNVLLQNISIYEAVTSMTVPEDNTKVYRYETFQMDSRIGVYLSDNKIPDNISQLGEFFSKKYCDKIREIEMMMVYDIYKPRFYGVFHQLRTDWNKFARPKATKTLDNRHNSKSPPLRSWKSCDSLSSPLPTTKNSSPTNRPTSLIPNVRVRFSTRKQDLSHKKRVSTDISSPTIEEAPCFPAVVPDEWMDQDDVVNTDTAEEQRTMIEMQKILCIGDGNEDNIEDVFRSQQDLLDEANKRKSRTDMEQRTEKSERNQGEQQNENPLYGFDSVPRVNRLKFFESSKPPEKEDSEQANYLSCSLDESVLRRNMRKQPTRKNDYEVTFTRLSISSPENRDGRRSLSGHEIDSGIDSPEVRRSLENIHQDFPRRCNSNEKEKNEIRSNSVDSGRNISSAPSESFDDSLLVMPTCSPVSVRNHIKLFESSNKIEEKNITKEDINTGFKKSKSESSLANVCTKSPHYLRPKSLYDAIDFVNCSDTYMQINSSKVRQRRFTNELQKQEIESLEEISELSIEKVVEILKELQLEIYAEEFRENLVTGELLTILSEDALRDLGLTQFETRKLFKFVHGWRVNLCNCKQSLEDVPAERWSVEDVQTVLKKINLRRLATFTAENQIDGVLLEDIIRKDLLSSLDTKEHGVRLNILEKERLRAYVYKDVKYN